jgi:hypothetical protein
MVFELKEYIIGISVCVERLAIFTEDVSAAEMSKIGREAIPSWSNFGSSFLERSP